MDQPDLLHSPSAPPDAPLAVGSLLDEPLVIQTFGKGFATTPPPKARRPGSELSLLPGVGVFVGVAESLLHLCRSASARLLCFCPGDSAFHPLVPEPALPTSHKTISIKLAVYRPQLRE